MVSVTVVSGWRSAVAAFTKRPVMADREALTVVPDFLPPTVSMTVVREWRLAVLVLTNRPVFALLATRLAKGDSPFLPWGMSAAPDPPTWYVWISCPGKSSSVSEVGRHRCRRATFHSPRL